MVVDEYGLVGYSQQEIIDHLKVNPNFDITGLFITDGESYKTSRLELFMEDTMPEINLWTDREQDLSVVDYHKTLQQAWLMPEEYSNLNIEQYLFDKCKTETELKRVRSELELYKKFDMIDLLKYLKYLRNVAEKNDIVWGVGRGSSCASYCLFLMGIHKVDSIKFELDICDFLRD